MSDIIQRIQQKLAYLREHEDYDVTDAAWERDFQIVGGRFHRYRLSAPASESQVAAFEAQHGIRLPEDYRRFLLEVGTRGAGPGYHLLSPFKDLKTPEEARQLSGEEKEFWEDFGAVIGDLRQPFPFTVSVEEDEVEALADERGWEAVENMLAAGNIMVCYAGDLYWTMLIVTGESRGQIWSRYGPSVSPELPAPGETLKPNSPSSPDGKPVTFTRWYEAWLDNDLAVAQAHWQKRGRNVPPLSLV